MILLFPLSYFLWGLLAGVGLVVLIIAFMVVAFVWKLINNDPNNPYDFHGKAKLPKL